MSVNAIVVMNERHVLIKEQKALFDLQFGNWSVKHIVDGQWSHRYFMDFQEELEDSKVPNIAFVSPCSLLIAEMSFLCGMCSSEEAEYPNIWILHAANRVTKMFGSNPKLIPDANSYILVPMRT